MSSSLKLGTFALLASRIVSLIVNFVSIGYLSRVLDKESFGLWSVIGVFVFLSSAFDFGLTQGMRNRLTSLFAIRDASDIEERQTFFGTLYAMLIICVTMVIIIIIIFPLFDWSTILNINSQYINESILFILKFVVCMSIFNLVLGLGSVGFLSYQESILKSVFDIIQSLLLLSSIFIFGKSQDVKLIILFYYSVHNITSFISLFMFIHIRQWSVPKLTLSQVSESIKLISANSFQFWILSVSAVLLFTTDPLIAARVIGLSEAGDFNVLQKLFSIIITLHLTALAPLWSAYTHSAANQNWSFVKRLYRRSQITTGVLVVIGGIVALILHGPMLLIWTGREFNNFGLVFALVIWTSIYAWINCASTLLNGLNSLKLQSIFAAIGVILHWFLGTVFGIRFGSLGIVVGSIISILPLLIVTLVVAEKILKERVSE